LTNEVGLTWKKRRRAVSETSPFYRILPYAPHLPLPLLDHIFFIHRPIYNIFVKTILLFQQGYKTDKLYNKKLYNISHIVNKHNKQK